MRAAPSRAHPSAEHPRAPSRTRTSPPCSPSPARTSQSTAMPRRLCRMPVVLTSLPTCVHAGSELPRPDTTQHGRCERSPPPLPKFTCGDARRLLRRD